jgi:hypothetical protein
MKFVFSTLLELIRAISYKWVLALITIGKQLKRFVKLFFERQKQRHSDTNATNTGCGPIDHTSFHRPDPLIYSQKYLLSSSSARACSRSSPS